MEKAKALDAQRLRDVLDCDPNTGVFTWLMKLSKSAPPVGGVAGNVGTLGYRHIQIDGHRHFAHRLVWLYFYGVWPVDRLDHKNGLKDDNRLCNLREATNAQNQQNQRAPSKNNKSGYLGVSWHKSKGKWQASIRANASCTHLGYFTDPKEAHVAYVQAKRQLHSFCTI